MLDEIQQRLYIDRHSNVSGLTSVPLLSGNGTLKRWLDSDLYRTVISIYRESGINQDLVPAAVKAAIEQHAALLHEQKIWTTPRS